MKTFVLKNVTIHFRWWEWDMDSSLFGDVELSGWPLSESPSPLPHRTCLPEVGEFHQLLGSQNYKFPQHLLSCPFLFLMWLSFFFPK